MDHSFDRLAHLLNEAHCSAQNIEELDEKGMDVSGELKDLFDRIEGAYDLCRKRGGDEDRHKYRGLDQEDLPFADRRARGGEPVKTIEVQDIKTNAGQSSAERLLWPLRP